MAAAAGLKLWENKHGARILQRNGIEFMNFAGNLEFPAFLLPDLLPNRLVFGKILTGAAAPAQEGRFPCNREQKTGGSPLSLWSIERSKKGAIKL